MDINFLNVCGWIRTTGAFEHISLAGRHLQPLGHANLKWAGPDSNWRRPRPTDLQSAAIAAMRPAHNVKRRAWDSTPDILSECRFSRPVLYQLSHLCIKEKPPASYEVSGLLNMSSIRSGQFCRICLIATFSRICLSLHEGIKIIPHSETSSSDDS